jgi:hypothetical protein
MSPKSNNAAGVATTNGIQKINFQIHFSINGRGDHHPLGLRAFIPDSVLDEAFSPLWSLLSREQGRSFFKQLGSHIGNTKLFTLLGASYIRFLNRKAVA